MAHTLYENEVLADKLESLLTTTIDMNAYMTVDNSLTESEGMKKVINTYTWQGDVEDLAMGEGNTGEITIGFTPTEYSVKTTQGKTSYFDEQAMTDSNVVDYSMRGLSEAMTNDLTAKAIAEMGKATITHTIPASGLDFDTIVDAIAKYNYEDKSGLFLLINPAEQAELRKNLGESLKYVEDFVRTGYIGTVCGVPVIISKAVPANTAFLGTSAAVTCFVKKGTEIEQERDKDKRKNTIFARKVMLVALTDATRMIKLVKA